MKEPIWVVQLDPMKNTNMTRLIKEFFNRFVSQYGRGEVFGGYYKCNVKGRIVLRRIILKNAASTCFCGCMSTFLWLLK